MLLAAVFAHYFIRVVGRRRKDIPIVEKCVFRLAYIHKRRLEARFKILYFPFKNSPYHAFVAGAFNLEFLHNAVDEQCHAFFKRLDIYDDFTVGIVLAFQQSYYFFQERALFCAQPCFEIQLGFRNRLDRFLYGAFCQIVWNVIGFFLFHLFRFNRFFAKLPSLRILSPVSIDTLN